MGGGGLIQLVQIVISDIVSLQEYVFLVLHRRAALRLIHSFAQVAASTVVSSVRHGELQGECYVISILQALNRLLPVA